MDYQFFIVSIIEFISILLLVYKLIEKPFEIKQFSLYLVVFVVIEYLLHIIVTDTSLWFIVIILLLYFYIKFAFKKSLFDSFFILGITYLILILSQILYTIVIGITAKNFNQFIIEITANVFTLIISILIYRFVPISFFIDFIKKYDYGLKALLINGIVIMLFISSYSKISPDSFFQNFFIIELLVAALVFINIEAFIIRFRFKKQNQQLEAYNNYLPIIEQLITHVRSIQHNHDNDIQTVASLSHVYTNYSDLSSALLNYSNNLIDKNSAVPFLKLKTKLVAALLYNKQVQAANSNKNLSVQIVNYNINTKMPEYDLVEIMGILINNSLEAIKEHETSWITIDSSDEKIKFTTKNKGPIASPELLTNIFKKGYTTKTDQAKDHGLGLYHLKKLVNQYNGEILVDNEILDDICYFCISVIL